MKKLKFLLTSFAVFLLAVVLTVSASALALGDINGDNDVTAADARLALRASVHLEYYAPGSAEFAAADVDSNGAIDAADARLILRASVHLQELHKHEYGSWTAEKNGTTVTGRHLRKCSCGDTEYAQCTYGAAKEVSPATCTEKNRVTQSCTVCGGTKTTSTKAALGHKKVQLNATDPTCTTTGKITYKCSVCGRNLPAETKAIPALGHDPKLDDTKTEQPTCTEKGTEYYNCTRCGTLVSTKPINALGHDFTATDVQDANTLVSVADCTHDTKYYYTCSRCGTNAKNVDATKVYAVEGTALGHEYTEYYAETALGKNMHNLYCSRCKKDTVLGFNDLVNAIKSPAFANNYDVNTGFVHTVHSMTKTTTISDCDNIDFGIWTALVKPLYEEDLIGTEVEYKPLYERMYIPSALPVSSITVTSELTEEDAVITQEKITGLKGSDLLKNFDSKYTVGSKEYDVSAYKTKTVNTGILKITAKINKEDFFGTNGVSQLADTDKTALQKITGYNMRYDIAEYGDDYMISESDSDGSSYDIRMDMKLTQMTSDGTVTYYFRESDLAPIAAVYNYTTVISQDVTMSMRIIAKDPVDGTMDPVITTNVEQVYLFNDFFSK